ncbi:MAG: InlB B-repeat-containing protein [Fibrobacter sp.]|jgi:uncharacterized repeat protein (TIGR02543 family)|nr:InlB B-repeat-containing protein [Fibrobacter sp.]
MRSLSSVFKKFLLPVAVGCLTSLFVSCSELSPPGGSKQDPLGQKTELKGDAEIAKAFLGKWPVPEGRYESFEFLPNGLFMVVERKNSSRPARPGDHLRKAAAVSEGVHYGSWEVVNGKVVLNGFGEITEPKTYADVDVRLGFTVASENGLLDIVTEVAADDIIDDDAKHISKVWLSQGIYTDAALSVPDPKAPAAGYTVLFTRAGTYFVLDSNDPAAIENGTKGDTRYAEWSGSLPNITYHWNNGVSGEITVICLDNSSLPCPSDYALVVEEEGIYYTFAKLPDANVSGTPAVDGVLTGNAKILDFFGGACTYVWKAGEDVISGCTGTSCTLTPAEECKEISFGVVCGEDYESDVVIHGEVITPALPAITTQPGNVNLMPGADHSLTVSIEACSGCSYQWYKGESKIDGATGASYEIPETDLVHGFTSEYHVVITNGSGTCTASEISDKATVKVPSVPVAECAASATTWTKGSGVAAPTLTPGVTNSNNGAILYGWNAIIGDAPSFAEDTAGTYKYKLQAINRLEAGVEAFSDEIDCDPITINPEVPVVSPTANSSVSVALGGTSPALTISVDALTALPLGTLSYQWYSNATNSNEGGSLIAGATGKTYNAPAATAGTVYYYAVATNTDNGITAIAKSGVFEVVVETTNYTVTYNGNGNTSGAVPTDETEYQNNEPVTVLGNTGTLVKTGYIFAGWNTKADGTGTNYAAGATFNITANVTLYAKWTAETYTVTYDANGGTGAPAAQTKTFGVNLTLSSDKPARDGYTFALWNTKADSTGTDYAAGTNYTANAAVTLYAQWIVKKYMITWNVNGGAPIPTQTILNHGESVTTPVAITRAGYTFGGWFMDDGFVTAAVFPIENVTANVTLYAKWAADTYTITYHLDNGTNNGTNPAAYTIETPTITLAVPTKDGFTFGGWYSEAGFVTSVTQIAQGSTGNKDFWAKWTENPVLTCAVGGTRSGIKGASFTATAGYTASCANGAFAGTVQWKLGSSDWGTGENMGTTDIPNLNGNQDVKVSATCGGVVQEVTCTGGSFNVLNATLTCGAEITGEAGTAITERPVLTCDNGKTATGFGWNVSGAPNWGNPVEGTFTFTPTADCGVATGLTTSNSCSVKVDAASVPACQYDPSWCGDKYADAGSVPTNGTPAGNGCLFVTDIQQLCTNSPNGIINGTGPKQWQYNCWSNNTTLPEKKDGGYYIYLNDNNGTGAWSGTSGTPQCSGGGTPPVSSSSSIPIESSSSSIIGCSAGAKIVEVTSSNFNTGNLDVGAVCVKITGNVQGGCGLSNNAGRTCKVNGSVYTGGKPDAAGDGFTYIDCSAGDYSYFAIYCY